MSGKTGKFPAHRGAHGYERLPKPSDAARAAGIAGSARRKRPGPVGRPSRGRPGRRRCDMAAPSQQAAHIGGPPRNGPSAPRRPPGCSRMLSLLRTARLDWRAFFDEQVAHLRGVTGCPGQQAENARLRQLRRRVACSELGQLRNRGHAPSAATPIDRTIHCWPSGSLAGGIGCTMDASKAWCTARIAEAVAALGRDGDQQLRGQLDMRPAVAGQLVGTGRHAARRRRLPGAQAKEGAP